MKLLKSQSGFTLTELVIVIAIIGVLASIAVGSFKNWNQAGQFNDQLASVRAPFARAMELARARQECVKLKVDNTLHTLTVEAYTPGASFSCTAIPGTKTVTLPAFTVDSTTQMGQFSNGTDTLWFDIHGGLRDGDVVTMTVTGAQGQFRTLSVYPAVGQTRYDGE